MRKLILIIFISLTWSNITFAEKIELSDCYLDNYINNVWDKNTFLKNNTVFSRIEAKPISEEKKDNADFISQRYGYLYEEINEWNNEINNFSANNFQKFSIKEKNLITIDTKNKQVIGFEELDKDYKRFMVEGVNRSINYLKSQNKSTTFYDEWKKSIVEPYKIEKFSITSVVGEIILAEKILSNNDKIILKIDLKNNSTEQIFEGKNGTQIPLVKSRQLCKNNNLVVSDKNSTVIKDKTVITAADSSDPKKFYFATIKNNTRDFDSLMTCFDDKKSQVWFNTRIFKSNPAMGYVSNKDLKKKIQISDFDSLIFIEPSTKDQIIYENIYFWISEYRVKTSSSKTTIIKSSKIITNKNGSGIKDTFFNDLEKNMNSSNKMYHLFDAAKKYSESNKELFYETKTDPLIINYQCEYVGKLYLDN